MLTLVIACYGKFMWLYLYHLKLKHSGVHTLSGNRVFCLDTAGCRRRKASQIHLLPLKKIKADIVKE